jgi:hypothetical protein
MATKPAVKKDSAYPADLDKAIALVEKSIQDAQNKIVELEARKMDLENQKPLREAKSFVGKTYVKRNTCRTNGEGEYARVLSASKDHPGKVVLETFQCVGAGASASFRREEMDWIMVETHYEPLGETDFRKFRAAAIKSIA